MNLFRSLVGHLMWLANQTRPDILNAVRAVVRYSVAGSVAHCDIYLKSTSTYGTTFQRGLSSGVQLEL